jgi:hypothetical protein
MIGTTHCVKCHAEAPLDSEGRCDYCGIESSEAEHEANNARLAPTAAQSSEPEGLTDDPRYP